MQPTLRRTWLNEDGIYVPQAKGGAREQPITESLAITLRGYVEAGDEEQKWLFPSTRSASGYTMNIEKSFRRVVAAAGLDLRQVVRHTLRHTAITHLVQAGVDLPTVQRISGHKTLQMVVRYSHQNGEHIQAAMDKLDRRYHSAGKTRQRDYTRITQKAGGGQVDDSQVIDSKWARQDSNLGPRDYESSHLHATSCFTYV
jgi:Phage integrase family